MKLKKNPKPFRSAKTELKNSLSRGKKVAPPLLAFTDPEFILRKEMRPVRLMLELMKPEIIQKENKIESTIVIFGSARICSPEVAKEEVKKTASALKQHPKKLELIEAHEIAKSLLEKSVYYEEARRLSYLISKNCQKGKRRHFVVVTGGGPGIMEAANRGAEDAHAKSIGLNITLPMEQEPNPFISPELSFNFHYFAIRKMHFLIRSRALIAFPGGYGTLDELFETLTLLQTNKIKYRMPVLLFSKKYWSNIINFQALVDQDMIAEEDLKLFQYVESAEEAWDVIAKFYQLKKK